jgi:hypothetical protein
VAETQAKHRTKRGTARPGFDAQFAGFEPAPARGPRPSCHDIVVQSLRPKNGSR